MICSAIALTGGGKFHSQSAKARRGAISADAIAARTRRDTAPLPVRFFMLSPISSCFRFWFVHLDGSGHRQSFEVPRKGVSLALGQRLTELQSLSPAADPQLPASEARSCDLDTHPRAIP